MYLPVRYINNVKVMPVTRYQVPGYTTVYYTVIIKGDYNHFRDCKKSGYWYLILILIDPPFNFQSWEEGNYRYKPVF